MNFANVVNDIRNDITEFSAVTFIHGSLGFCAGYAVASCVKANPLLTGQVLAIASIASYIFMSSVGHALQGSREKKAIVYVLGLGFGGVALSCSLKNLGILSQLGASILTIGFGALLLELHYID